MKRFRQTLRYAPEGGGAGGGGQNPLAPGTGGGGAGGTPGGTGAGGSTTPPADPPEPTPPIPVGNLEAAGWTEAQRAEMTRIATAEAAKGKRQGAKEAKDALAEQLGVPLDQVEGIVKAHQQAADALKTQQQRDAEAASVALADAQRIVAETNIIAISTQINAGLVRAGVTDPKTQDRLALWVAIPGDTAPAELTAKIDEQVAALKTDYPALFATQAQAPGPPSHTAPGAPPPPSQQPGIAGGLERGRLIAEERAKSQPTLPSGSNPLGT